jgi:hypothetical protein
MQAHVRESLLSCPLLNTLLPHHQFKIINFCHFKLRVPTWLLELEEKFKFEFSPFFWVSLLNWAFKIGMTRPFLKKLCPNPNKTCTTYVKKKKNRDKL